jgi:cytochrome bd-type quinol oxidase subunit 2
MKKGVKKTKEKLIQKETRKKVKIYWVSVVAFIFSIVGWMSFGLNDDLFNFYAFIILCISPVLGVFGLVRASKEKDIQIKVFNDALAGIGIIISVLFLSFLLIGLLI